MKSVRFGQQTYRIKYGLTALAFVSIQLAAVLNPFSQPSRASASVSDKVTICHRTASYSNPYVELTVDKSAVDGIAGNSGNEADHYGEHKGPIFYPAIPKHTEWGDIIPAIIGVHSGLNWTTEGQAILNNHCRLGESGTVKVNKKVDADGNGVYEGGNTTANNLGFDWILGDDPTLRDMGTSVSGVPVGTHTVTETGGPVSYSFTGWYNTADEDNSGSHQVNCTYPQGTTLPIDVAVVKNKTTEITLCNQFKPGSIKIVKDAQPNHEQDFAFTATGSGVSNFTLDDNGSESTSGGGKKSNITFGSLASGSFSFTEAEVSGWDLSNIDCTGQSQSTFGRQGNTLNINLAVGENLVCTFTNQKRGHLIVQKTTVPAGNQTQFSISASGTGTVTSGASGSVTDATDHNYEVTPGTYSVTEAVPDGWSKTGDTCQNKEVAPGATVTCLLTNTKLGSISGTKYNVNKDNTTGSTLSGWTIFIDANGNNQLDQGETSDVTDVNGAYSFTNLLPDTYVLREVLTAGWTQIFGDGSVNLTAGQNSTGNDFGNQGHGTVQVNKNVDTDGDGDVDESGVTNWTWDLDGDGNYATGSTQNVAAGDYTVSEDQQTNYHFVSVTCDVNGEETKVAQEESFDISVAAGDEVVCTFTNARDTATITVNKVVAPSEDDGRFNLLIGNTVYAENVGDGGTTGQVRVPTGTYSVSEEATEGTKLTNYDTTNYCNWDEQRGGYGEGTEVNELGVERNENLVCTFTNTKRATVTVEKDADPADGTDFDFVLTPVRVYEDVSALTRLQANLVTPMVDEGQYFTLDDAATDDGDDFTNTESFSLAAGAYTIEEINLPEGWSLTDITCEGAEYNIDVSNKFATLYVESGANAHCTFTNEKPQVLGEVTPVAAVTTTPNVLANTGTSDVARNAVIGLTIVMMTITLAFATRRQNNTTK